MMLPSSWKPVPANDLIRLGPAGDGGYIVSLGAVRHSRLLLSFGLNDDWRFERAFQKLSGAQVVCFDHTVTPRFWVLHALKQVVRLRVRESLKYFAYRAFFGRANVEHRRIKIGYDGAGESSLASLLEEFKGDAIFLKCDIEGAEYRILDDVIANADRLTGMAFEFHDIDLNRERLERFLAAMPQFKVLDFHANNYGGVDRAGDPLVVEISLVRSDLFAPASHAAPAASSLHAANDPTQPDIELSFAS